MSDSLTLTLALLWVCGCLGTFVMTTQIPHRCHHRACPHLRDKE